LGTINREMPRVPAGAPYSGIQFFEISIFLIGGAIEFDQLARPMPQGSEPDTRIIGSNQIFIPN
jgi:hypothetical protein